MDYFDYEYRVRYADTDKMGISYYANYLIWFEAARTEYFRALGFPYVECERQKVFCPVSEVGVKYSAPTTYDDSIVIRTSISSMKRSSVRFEYQVSQKGSGKAVAAGFTVHVFVDEKMRPVSVPEPIRKGVTVCPLRGA